MNIKFYREKMHLSQRELADKIETTQATLQRYEAGINQPNIETMIKLADFFQISLDDLVGRKSNSINLNFYSKNKKAIIEYLIQEDEKTIERIYDFYKGLKYEKISQLGIFDNNYTDKFENRVNNFVEQEQENQLLKSIQQTKILKELNNDPYFNNLPDDKDKK